MDVLWLGYDGLEVRCDAVVAVLFYHPALDARVRTAYGRVPGNVRAIVVTSGGQFLPSSWSVEHLRERLAHWRNTAAP